MSESTPTPAPPVVATPTPTPPRAINYAWRLLMLVPALLLAGYGYWRYTDVPDGGWVNAIRLTSKPGIAGQTRDAYASIDPTTPDYYLILIKRGDARQETPPFKDTQLGNGLTFKFDSPIALGDIDRVEVWDHNALLKDKQLDRIELSGAQWQSAGQTYVIDLQGTHESPPKWALPLAAIGATLGAVVILKFVWDQAL